MPRNYRQRAEPEDDAEARYDDLLERYEFLRSNAEEVIRENTALQNQAVPAPQPPAPVIRSTAGVFLVLLAFLVLGRCALFAFVQDWGMRESGAGTIFNLLFGPAAVLLLAVWVRAEWKEIAWLAAIKYIFVFVMLFLCTEILDGGALLSGDFDTTPTDPIAATFLAVVSLFFGASPLPVRIVRWLMRFLNAVFGGGE
jgi:hypothetical protein